MNTRLGSLCCIGWLMVGCGSDADSGPASVAGAGGSVSSAGSAGSAVAGSGVGGASAGATSGGAGGAAAGAGVGGSAAGSGGSVAGAASGGASAGAAGSAGAGTGFPDPSTFVCNAVFGVSVTGDWYNAGFETGLIGDRWQLRWKTQAFVEQWADPNNAVWSQALISGCANGSTNPDRVIFTGVNWTYTTKAEWESKLTAVVENLKTKYSALKEIDLMTMLRAPNNTVCGDPKVELTQEQVVAPYIDEAIAAVVAKYPKLVRAAPKFQAPSCDVFLKDSPHFANGKASVVAGVIRDHYSKN